MFFNFFLLGLEWFSTRM